MERTNDDLYGIRQDLSRIEAILFDPSYQTIPSITEEEGTMKSHSDETTTFYNILRWGSELRDKERASDDHMIVCQARVDELIEKEKQTHATLIGKEHETHTVLSAEI